MIIQTSSKAGHAELIDTTGAQHCSLLNNTGPDGGGRCQGYASSGCFIYIGRDTLTKWKLTSNLNIPHRIWAHNRDNEMLLLDIITYRYRRIHASNCIFALDDLQSPRETNVRCRSVHVSI
ncbi:hypothetical protein QCA50_005306 [Cerrena zonata]|uniref:Uncharacterized protein n=1 Tax=Cerrena zonata TaxID=2478898 RepID=A0AAW0GGK7_9APHY